MEKWHKIAIFLFGLVSLILYLITIYNEAVGEVENELKEDKVKMVKEIRYFSYLKVVILFIALFSLPILLHSLLLKIPKSEWTSEFGIIKFVLTLYGLKEQYLGDKISFSDNGYYLLEWFLILLPYIIGMTIWSIKSALSKLRS